MERGDFGVHLYVRLFGFRYFEVLGVWIDWILM